MKRFLARHSPLFILAGLCLILAAWSPDFRSSNNMQNVALRTCVIGIMATGQILVILTAGIDLSVGSVAALSGVIAAKLMAEAELPIGVGILGGCAVGLACGFINGILITKGRIPPFIVTLGMMMAARGVAEVASDSLPITLPRALKNYLGGAPLDGMDTWWIPVMIVLVITTGFSITLRATRFGRSLYATGGNLTGARLSGIQVDRVRALAYCMSGLLAGFAGVMLSARTGIADPAAAVAYELDAIAACVIGGASLMGGEGAVMGGLAGALIMKVLLNICNLNDISVHWQRVLVGALIVALVFYDNARKRKAGLLKE